LNAEQRAAAQEKQAAKAERRAARKEEERLAQEEAARKSRNRTLIAMVVGVVVVAGLILGGMKLFSDDRPLVAPDGVDGFSVVVGEEDAPSTVRIYADLQCPACASFEAGYGEQINDAIDAGRIKVEYRMVSFLDGASTNNYSSRATNALMATLDTAGVDAFKTLHDSLFAEQPAEGGAGFDDDELVQRAVAAGAEEGAVRPLIEDETFGKWIEDATDQWSKDGFNGTPVVLLDGEQVEDFESFAASIAG
jgi:protein-disulfide isomerase